MKKLYRNEKDRQWQMKKDFAQERREQKRARKKPNCFWTWPWGHIFEEHSPFTLICIVCGKTKAAGI